MCRSLDSKEPDARAVCPAAQNQVASLPLLPALVTVHQPVSATFAAPGAPISGDFPSGLAVNFSPGTPAALVCTANRPMHVEYSSFTGARQHHHLIPTLSLLRRACGERLQRRLPMNHTSGAAVCAKPRTLSRAL